MTGKKSSCVTGTLRVWLTDWYCSKNDRDILYHAAPTLGNCYDLDGQTGAFFYNTAGYLFSSGKLSLHAALAWWAPFTYDF